MAKTATAGASGEGTATAVNSRSPWLPCLLAWILPGAGHLLIRRTVPGLVLMAVVLTTFGVGLALEGTVYAMDPEQPLSYLSTAANLGMGPLDLWARQVTYGTLRYRIPDSRSGGVERERVLQVMRDRYSAPTHSYGRTFLLTAALMNLLLVLDVYDYCIGRKPYQRKSEAPSGECTA
jgi:hypothetical protein